MLVLVLRGLPHVDSDKGKMEGRKEVGEEANKGGKKTGKEGSTRVPGESAQFSSQETKSPRNSHPTDVCVCMSGPASYMTIPA